jgi:hypothetical protein
MNEYVLLQIFIVTDKNLESGKKVFIVTIYKYVFHTIFAVHKYQERIYFSSEIVYCGSSSVGRASASQAEGRGFESRFPLKKKVSERHLFLLSDDTWSLLWDSNPRPAHYE